MPTRQRRRLLHGQATWMGAALVALELLDALSLELFFVVAFAGFLVAALATVTGDVGPRLRRRVLALVLVGFLGFLLLFFLRVGEMLPPGVF